MKVSLKLASTKEAEARISNVIDPYIENLHPIYECSIRGIIGELKGNLIAEFEGFGFEYEDINTEPQCWGDMKENNMNSSYGVIGENVGFKGEAGSAAGSVGINKKDTPVNSIEKAFDDAGRLANSVKNLADLIAGTVPTPPEPTQDAPEKSRVQSQDLSNGVMYNLQNGAQDTSERIRQAQDAIKRIYNALDR